MARNKEATSFIFVIALLVCLVCASLVSVAAVKLKPVQDKVVALEKKRNILMAAGIYQSKTNVESLFSDKIETKMIELQSGQYQNNDIEKFDLQKTARNTKKSHALSKAEDLASIKRVTNNMVIYLQKGDSNQIENVILPIYGYGLWGTMYGFLAVGKDGQTIKGITFYEHKETPGLGGEITNPKWQATWDGKLAYENQQPAIRVVKSKSTNPDIAKHQIDALAGATLTSRGVENMLQFWLGPNGYQPFLQQLAKTAQQPSE